MAAYADYTYYTDTYLGAAIAEADFPRLALRASEQVDALTFNRAAAETDTDTVDRIKKATCAVAEELQAQELAGGMDAVQSETVGAHSVTYAPGASATRTGQEKLVRAASLYLGSTGLMFRGFDSGEYGGALED